MFRAGCFARPAQVALGFAQVGLSQRKECVLGDDQSNCGTELRHVRVKALMTSFNDSNNRTDQIPQA